MLTVKLTPTNKCKTTQKKKTREIDGLCGVLSSVNGELKGARQEAMTTSGVSFQWVVNGLGDEWGRQSAKILESFN